MNKFRNIIITAIYKFMQNNKTEDYDWESGNEYFSRIYNLNDLSDFIDDLRSNYIALKKSPYFPVKYIQLNEPVKLKNTGKKQTRRNALTDE